MALLDKRVAHIRETSERSGLLVIIKNYSTKKLKLLGEGQRQIFYMFDTLSMMLYIKEPLSLEFYSSDNIDTVKNRV